MMEKVHLLLNCPNNSNVRAFGGGGGGWPGLHGPTTPPMSLAQAMLLVSREGGGGIDTCMGVHSLEFLWKVYRKILYVSIF